MVDKKEETQPKLLVVTELPTQAFREGVNAQGDVFTCITTNEALAEIVETLREIRKKL